MGLLLEWIQKKFGKIKETNNWNDLETPQEPDFRVPLTDQIKESQSGRISNIFFSHQDEIIHKWVHYLPIYDSLLGKYAGSNVRMLEIGVFRGGSMAMWRKFLGPQAIIFGIDINPECIEFDGKHASVRIGSQDDPEFLRSVISEMGGVDIILDDGSHVASHQRASFEILFPLLNEDGLYIIEDLHTAYWPGWEGGLKRPGTAIEFLKDKVDEMHKHYQIKGLEKTNPELSIESIQFFDSITVVKKRAQSRRISVMTPNQNES